MTYAFSQVQFSAAPNAPVMARRNKKRELTKQYSKVSLYSGVMQEIEEPKEVDEAARAKSAIMLWYSVLDRLHH